MLVTIILPVNEAIVTHWIQGSVFVLAHAACRELAVYARPGVLTPFFSQPLLHVQGTETRNVFLFFASATGVLIISRQLQVLNHATSTFCQKHHVLCGPLRQLRGDEDGAWHSSFAMAVA